MGPWEIWLSEAQERMILSVPPSALHELLEICAIEEVEASVLGSFTNDRRLKLTYHSQIVADMDMTFLHNGIPRKRLEAIWTHVEPHLRHTSTSAAGSAGARDAADAINRAPMFSGNELPGVRQGHSGREK